MAFPPLVPAEWLAEHLFSPDIAIFDCTKYPPEEPRDGRVEFRRAHLPRALYLDLDEVADPDATLPCLLPAPARFAQLLGDLGVSNRSRVVFYDQQGLAFAARGWWLMRLIGHEAAAVLDGGLPRWLGKRYATEAGEPLPPAPVLFVPDLRPERLMLVEEVSRILAAGGALVAEVGGARRMPEPAWDPALAELLNPDQTLRDPASLRALFAAAGLDGTQPVVTSAGTGRTACLLALGMVWAGLPEGAGDPDRARRGGPPAGSETALHQS